MEFRWNDWNIEHLADKEVTPEEAEYVVETASSPYPRLQDDARYLVWGQSEDGRFLQVVFIIDPDGSIYPIHGRELTEREKKRYRRGAVK